MRFKSHRLALLLGAVLAGCAAYQTTPAPSPAPAPSAAPAAVAEPAPPPTAAAVKNMISNCFSCHGTDGRSAGAIPSLAGMNAKRAQTMLKGFKSGDIPATVMTRHAKGYTDAELEALANYIGSNLK